MSGFFLFFPLSSINDILKPLSACVKCVNIFPVKPVNGLHQLNPAGLNFRGKISSGKAQFSNPHSPLGWPLTVPGGQGLSPFLQSWIALCEWLLTVFYFNRPFIQGQAAFPPALWPPPTASQQAKILFGQPNWATVSLPFEAQLAFSIRLVWIH